MSPWSASFSIHLQVSAPATRNASCRSRVWLGETWRSLLPCRRKNAGLSMLAYVDGSAARTASRSSEIAVRLPAPCTKAATNSAGSTSPTGRSSRRWFHHSTHRAVASSSLSSVLQGARFLITSACW